MDEASSHSLRPPPGLHSSSPAPLSGALFVLPIEVWHEVTLYLANHMLPTYRAWILSCRRLCHIAMSESLWLARVKALFLALTSAGRIPLSMPLSETLYRQLIITSRCNQGRSDDNGGGGQKVNGDVVRWTWKLCFVHLFFAGVAQKCILCTAAPAPANQPTCTLRWRDCENNISSRLPPQTTSRVGVEGDSGREEEEEEAASSSPSSSSSTSSSSSLLAVMKIFPFEGCCVCSICLRRLFCLKSSPQGRREEKEGRRFFALHNRRWIVCLRSDTEDVIHQGGRHNQQHAQSKRPRGVKLLNTSGRSLDEVDDDDGVESTIPGASHVSVRMFVAQAQQAAAERHGSPYYRSYEAPPDPMRFLTWSGHTISH